MQIAESKFGKRKYHRGMHIEGHWVNGMIEDGTKNLRLEVCHGNERSADILVTFIKKDTEEGSIILTDYWRASLNHIDSTNKFVAPDGTRTQRIERQWRGLKKQFRQQQNKHNFTDWF